MTYKLWKVASFDKSLAKRLAEAVGVDQFAALLAVSRGMTDEDEVRAFFDKDSAELSDPFLLPDMQKAADRINRAIDSGERIAIFGDYDADGVTATAILCSYFEARGADFFYYIPNRHTEGYGISLNAVEILAERGAKLIVTVDNGISAVEEARLSAQKGIDMVVTDHHRVGEAMPECVAVVNPHREDCELAFRDYAGAGVAFKLVCALEGGECEEQLEELSDLAAIGTIADVVPLLGENRTIVSRGLKLINENPRPGINALKIISSTAGKTLDSVGVSMSLAPRLNAAGRMGSPERALRLLLASEPDEAEELASEIEGANLQRQKTEQEILLLAEKQLDEHPKRRFDRVLVCDGEGWFAGVIGIVAARLAERYGKPCIVISREGESARGSGRSLEGFSLYDALNAVSDCLTSFGGHTLAAGLGLDSDKIDIFRQAINEYAAQAEMPFPVQKIDVKLSPKYLTTEVLDAFALLAPFGAGNSQPVIGLFNMKLDKVQPVSEGRHLRLTVSREGTALSAMLFGTPREKFPFDAGDVIDLAAAVYPNEYMGEVRVGIRVKAVRLSDISTQELLDGERLFEKFMRGEALSHDEAFTALPQRDFIGKLYSLVRAQKVWKRGFAALCREVGGAEDFCKTLVSLETMRELGLFTVSGETVGLSENQTHVELDSSTLLAGIRAFL